MFKMVKHSTSMKPDSSRLGGIRWGVSLWQISWLLRQCVRFLCVRVRVCPQRNQSCVRRKIIYTISAFASFLFIWFRPHPSLSNPNQTNIFDFQILFHRCCLFSSFLWFQYLHSAPRYCLFFFFLFLHNCVSDLCCCAGIVYKLPWKRYSTRCLLDLKMVKMEQITAHHPLISPVGCICWIGKLFLYTFAPGFLFNNMF